MTPGEVGDAMHVTSGSMTSLVDTLVKNGWVARAAHGEDRRKVLLDITAEGLAMLNVVLPEIAALTTALMQTLSNDDQAAITLLLERAAASEKAVVEDPPATAPRRRPRRAAAS